MKGRKEVPVCSNGSARGPSAVKPRGRSGSPRIASPGGRSGRHGRLSLALAVGAARGLLGGGRRRCGSGSGSRLHLRRGRGPAAMAYSTVQRLALASGLVLAVSLLLPKAFLSRGKRQEPPPAPEGKRGQLPLSRLASPLYKRRANAARGRGDSGSLRSPARYPQIWRRRTGPDGIW